MTIDELNTLSPVEFLARLGGLYEHSPWIVEVAEGHRPFPDVEALITCLETIVRDAGEAAQLALLQAHPELAGKAMIDRQLTASSAAEQASAGLDRMTPEEFETFHALNSAYRAQFGFPFIICVRLSTKHGILAAMKARLENARAEEFALALSEVFKIVRLRIKELVG